ALLVPPGPQAVHASLMFLPVSFAAAQVLVTPPSASARFLSNVRSTVVVSLDDGVNCERTRTPSLAFTDDPTVSAPPPDLSSRTVPQESLPAVAGKLQVGTTGGAAAALPVRAKSPTPRAAAEATSNPIRLLVRMYRSPP